MTIDPAKLSANATLLEKFQAETKLKTSDIPPDKHAVVVVAADWMAGVPYRWRFGTAVRVGNHFELDAETQTKFTKASTNASIHAIWSF